MPKDYKTVQNVNTEEIINAVVKEATNTLFAKICAIPSLYEIAQRAATSLAAQLKDNSFMTTQLELTALQRDELGRLIDATLHKCREEYTIDFNKENDTELRKVYLASMKTIVAEALNGISEEINRGAIISCKAVAADTKNDKHNKIELNYIGNEQITIPTFGIFIATNCVEVIQQSVYLDEEAEDEANPELDENKVSPDPDFEDEEQEAA